MQRQLGTETAEAFQDAASLGSHVFGYTNGMLTTDTWTVNGVVYVKTYSYTNGVLTGESDWVKQ